MKKVKIGNVAKIFNGYAFKSTEYSDDGFQVIRITNVQNGYISNDNQKYIKLNNKSLERFILNDGDILISLTGNVGRVGRIGKENLPAVLNQRVGKVVIQSKEIFPDYLFHILKSGVVESELVKKAKGIAQKNIGSLDIENIEIPLPPVEDQKRIVKILDEADALRQKRKQSVGLLDDYLKSVFLEMFGDPVKNEKGYSIQTINDVAIKEKHGIKAGPFGSSLKKEFYVKSGYKIYGQEQVIKDDFNYGDYYINEKRYHSLESCKIQQGDILISLVGTFGKISVVPEKFEPGIINPRLMKITPNQNIIIPLFLKELLTSQSVQKQIKDVSHGGTMGIVNVGIIKKIKILVPSLDEQKKYIELKEKIESVKQAMLTQSAELETQFQALMQKAFKGEL